jgi:hypothetical protein
MNRRPTSYGDMIKSVLTVRFPDLKPHHRLLLVSLAAFADGQTGKSSRPTYAYLKISLGEVQDTWVALLLKELAQFGLIEKTHKGSGPGNASIFRICLEHAAFPDTYPTMTLDDEYPQDVVRVSNQIPSVNGENTLTKEAEYPHSDNRIPSPRGEDHPKLSSETSIQPSHPEIRKADGGMDSSKPSAKEPEKSDTENFFDKHHKTMGRCEKKTRRQIEALAEREGQGHPWELMNEIALRFQNRTRGLVGLRDTWGNFLTEAPQNISDLRKDSWWQEKYDPAYKEKMALAVARGRWGCAYGRNWESRFYTTLTEEEKETVKLSYRAAVSFTSLAEIQQAHRKVCDLQQRQDVWEEANPETVLAVGELF